MFSLPAAFNAGKRECILRTVIPTTSRDESSVEPPESCFQGTMTSHASVPVKELRREDSQTRFRFLTCQCGGVFVPADLFAGVDSGLLRPCSTVMSARTLAAGAYLLRPRPVARRGEDLEAAAATLDLLRRLHQAVEELLVETERRERLGQTGVKPVSLGDQEDGLGVGAAHELAPYFPRRHAWSQRAQWHREELVYPKNRLLSRVNGQY